jgi:hypothetical protein
VAFEIPTHPGIADQARKVPGGDHTIHDFVMLAALADTPAARGAIAQAVCALKTALG